MPKHAYSRRYLTVRAVVRLVTLPALAIAAVSLAWLTYLIVWAAFS